mmetsp:Transcript_11067/g.13092  ORF Transcript_11067/g.13092 Transcript_11067/m.13092 type:complete len:155 (+) Transcript_11067:76-540(+)|eukprot:CAMPEP_0198251462 /NCGR_PEP_ID=MMETSP1447-20131203/2289_1 /TAXON_ID=420782 /ORGANISM="Chaetoceros dichaeta, Strain CCMP1751" /LENGTH=154 /DNA_ID=CAMNT_0043936489 /DNA_START=44 /DNA_END=508 /DNA_ORIENTATION=-
MKLTLTTTLVAAGTLAVAVTAFSNTRSISARPSSLKNAFGLSRTSPTCKSSALNMSTSPADFVTSKIAADDVVVFSKSTCPFCRKTKGLLEDLQIPFTVYEINDLDNGADVQDALLELSGQRTVPNVFIKGKHVGGNDDMQAASKDGTLKAMLE